MARPSFRESVEAVADDVYPGTTHNTNTLTPQSALCICSRKWRAKLIVAIYSGTNMSKFCLRVISFSSLESELGFDMKDSEINFDRVRSATPCEITTWNFGSNFAIFQAMTGKTSLWTSYLYIRSGKLDTKWKRRKMKSRKEKSRSALDGKFDF